jgi:uncharacterized protein
MSTDLIPITFHKIMQSRTYTVIILGNEKKKFAIYTLPQVGSFLQGYLTQETKSRPSTYDLMSLIFKGLNVKILQIVINRIEDTIYFARLFLEQELGEQKLILEIDARPSDCLALAIMNQIPIFCRKDIFDQILALEE